MAKKYQQLRDELYQKYPGMKERVDALVEQYKREMDEEGTVPTCPYCEQPLDQTSEADQPLAIQTPAPTPDAE